MFVEGLGHYTYF